MRVSWTLAGDKALHRRTGNRQGQAPANHGVDTDDAAVGVNEWAPGVSGSQSYVSLEPVSGTRPFERSRLTGGDDDAGGRGAAEPRRMSDGDGNLPWAHCAGITEPRRRQPVNGDLDDREIPIGVAGG